MGSAAIVSVSDDLFRQSSFFGLFCVVSVLVQSRLHPVANILVRFADLLAVGFADLPGVFSHKYI